MTNVAADGEGKIATNSTCGKVQYIIVALAWGSVPH
jgi:hypothetical protein